MGRSIPRSGDRRSAWRWCAGLAALAALTIASPVAAQEDGYHLFDKFSIALEGTLAKMDTVVRLDSKALGKGTQLDFENDGGLASSKFAPTVSFEWMMGRRHRLGGWWMKFDRDATKIILKEIQFGDQVFPIDEEVRFLYGTDEVALDYTYFLTMKPRHAFGISGGFRTLKTTIGLRARGIEVAEEGDFTAPLPFVGFEYRYGIGPKWRLISNLGVFYIEVGDFSGSQLVLDAWVEYLASQRFSVGAGLRGARVDAEMTTSTELAGDFTGAYKASIGGARLFARVRF